MNNLPIHPMLVHFPIALFCFEFFLLFWGYFKNRKDFLDLAQVSFFGAYFFLLLSLGTGYLDAGGEIQDLFGAGVKPHFYAAAVLFFIATVRLILWKTLTKSGRAGFVPVKLVGSALTVAALLVTGYWGGHMVYNG
ncbi:MAG: hypothetical protein A2Y02_01025 [Omnitrophica bacterium GWA2_52_12]|nr:MAG: hypothetical protein A2Y02_01025 [Omnitrophica bacterium GWA2_52_12]